MPAVCMFCGDPIEDTTDAVSIELRIAEEGASSHYWGHSQCLVGATHASVPLYLLSLRTDAAVFGSRS